MSRIIVLDIDEAKGLAEEFRLIEFFTDADGKRLARIEVPDSYDPDEHHHHPHGHADDDHPHNGDDDDD